ncbi:hypothetical protein ACFFYR_10410 [Paraburkholderia dipogonis]|uniref:hypothetical protein n=1 Tax=Paraburkholderia dipogonis TaxID=1211383 RepID=UPI0035ED2ADB
MRWRSWQCIGDGSELGGTRFELDDDGNLSAAGYNPGSSTLSVQLQQRTAKCRWVRQARNAASRTWQRSAATDAVNVSQLMSEDAKLNNVSNNVSNIAGNVTNISNTVNNITNGALASSTST